MSQPWFPFYVGDYVRDTARLTTEGHGAYLLLMLDYWANGAPPDDNETLSNIARLSLDAWVRLRQKLEPFFQISNGRWLHKRIERERENANEKHEKRVNAGRAGGNAKANNKQWSSLARPLPPALLYQSQPQSQPLKKTGSRSIAGDRPTRAIDPKQIDLEDAIAVVPAKAPSRFEDFWQAYPRREGPSPRKPAETKFNALVKTGIDPAMMIAEAQKLASAEAARGNIGTRFIPQAVTWLNQQRWADHAAVAFVAEQAAEKRAETYVHVKAGTPQWAAWALTRAKPYPTDKNFGWFFPSEWPPGHDRQQGPNCSSIAA
jgi:uncharacterized protein YdaU (DUF1376 family)